METRVDPATQDPRQAPAPPFCCQVVEGTVLVVARAGHLVVVIRPSGTPVELMVAVAAVLLSADELTYLSACLSEAT